MDIGGYLIYHPAREMSELRDIKVFHDSLSGNQDPYVWNNCFLHTYCHITQMKPQEGHINFWVTDDVFPNFTHLYCDLVFVVKSKQYWVQPNTINPTDAIVDSPAAYNDHYHWAELGQHNFKRRRRFTLKADPKRSFQPQDANSALLDVLPFLGLNGIEVAELRRGMQAGHGSQPYALSKSQTNGLYLWIQEMANIKLTGEFLVTLHKKLNYTYSAT